MHIAQILLEHVFTYFILTFTLHNSILRFSNALVQLREDYKWSYLNYTFESEVHYHQAVLNGTYNYTQNILYDAGYDLVDDRVFVAVAREPGVPSSLNTVDKTRKCPGTNSYLLKPYPNWDLADITDCSNIINVYRFAMDRCDRLWVLDNGFNSDLPYCPPKILQFNLRTNKLEDTIPIKQDYGNSRNYGLLTNIIVQQRGPCSNYSFYIADATTSGLLVYRHSHFVRFEFKELENEISHPSVMTGLRTPDRVNLFSGSMNLAMTRDNELYFSPVGSNDIASVKTDLLQFYRGSHLNKPKCVKYPRVHNRKFLSMVYSEKNSALLLGVSKEQSLICIPARKGLEVLAKEILVENSELLEYTISQKIIDTGKGYEKLVLVSNNLMAFTTNKMDFSRTNFRIMSTNLTKLMANTKCDLQFEVR